MSIHKITYHYRINTVWVLLRVPYFGSLADHREVISRQAIGFRCDRDGPYPYPSPF